MLLDKRIPLSYIFNKIKVDLLFVIIVGLVIHYFASTFSNILPDMPLTVAALLGTSISILLSFKMNQSYERWWEARKVWGAIVNDSRTLARQAISFTEIIYEGDEVQQFRERMVRRQVAWCYSLGQFLRGESAMRGLERHLTAEEMEYLKQYDHIPSALLDLHGRDLRLALENGWINRFQQVELDRTLSRLCDAMGKCERIKNTVFPVTYSMYIHLSLLLFIALLPFAVIQFFGLMEAPVVVAIATSFLLIEKMAIHLQDPFENKPTDTPVTTIARSIEKTLSQMIRHQTSVDTKQREDYFYVL